LANRFRPGTETWIASDSGGAWTSPQRAPWNDDLEMLLK
jgi:hypothetical protein